MRAKDQISQPHATKQRKDKFRKPKQFKVIFSESYGEKLTINGENYIWFNIEITLPQGYKFF